MMEWMSWTGPTAAFFSVIALTLAGMTTWELRSPSIPRRGFLPIATTRGDRLFIGLLGSAYLHLLVIGVTDWSCLLYTSPSPRDGLLSRMPSSA